MQKFTLKMQMAKVSICDHWQIVVQKMYKVVLIDGHLTIFSSAVCKYFANRIGTRKKSWWCDKEI